MSKPTLVIMAAGMGSRYGGLKQIDPVDEAGNKIVDFSIYDALLSGFGKIVFVIKREHETDFRSCIGDRIGNHAQIVYAYQELDHVPAGFPVPEGRVKPWGTAHAVLSAAPFVQGPFAVINADDFYGREAFRLISRQLMQQPDTDRYRYAMVGYKLGNTLTQNGSVSRGVCEIDPDGHLKDIVERTKIVRTERGAAYTEDGEHYVPISEDAVVSMNLWGFHESFLKEAQTRFEAFLKRDVPADPLRAECYLPYVVDELLKEGKAQVSVLRSNDRWFGVTYQEDKPFVMQSIRELKNAGVYPEKLWE